MAAVTHLERPAKNVARSTSANLPVSSSVGGQLQQTQSHTLFDGALIESVMYMLEDGIIGICLESIELGFIGHIAERKTAQFQERRRRFDIVDELRDRFDLFEMLYDECPQDGML